MSGFPVTESTWDAKYIPLFRSSRISNRSGIVPFERIACMVLRRCCLVRLSIAGRDGKIHEVGFVVYFVEINICAAVPQ